jgi:hypothetical protein
MLARFELGRPSSYRQIDMFRSLPEKNFLTIIEAGPLLTFQPMGIYIFADGL